jgi:hypothetical protein
MTNVVAKRIIAVNPSSPEATHVDAAAKAAKVNCRICLIQQES